MLDALVAHDVRRFAEVMAIWRDAAAGQALHTSATTMQAIRRATQHNEVTPRALTKHYRIKRKTITNTCAHRRESTYVHFRACFRISRTEMLDRTENVSFWAWTISIKRRPIVQPSRSQLGKAEMDRTARCGCLGSIRVKGVWS